MNNDCFESVNLIYDADYEMAGRTLRHEVLDYVFSGAAEPFKEVANKLILHWNEKEYKNKEDLVDRLCGLLEEREN